MMKKMVELGYDSVAPFTGAWIEICFMISVILIFLDQNKLGV